MLIPRIMPCLLLNNGSLVKTVQFDNPGYIGDPINAVRIYNEKEVDELIFLDITATVERRKPPFQVLSEIATECFMPVTYGGAVNDLDDIERILKLGIEKVAINYHAYEDPRFITEAAGVFGSQAIMVSIDVRQSKNGKYEVFTRRGEQATGYDPVAWALKMQEAGAGEILLTSVDRDGTQSGYDIELLRTVTNSLVIPVIASGGAGSVADFRSAIFEGGASACAAGSMVVYYGKNRAVLINFPSRKDLEKELTQEKL